MRVKAKKQIQLRTGYRKLEYFDGEKNPLNGTWQWKFGQKITIYSPEGKKFTPWSDDVCDDLSCGPYDVRHWIERYGFGPGNVPKKSQKKPRELQFSHRGMLILIECKVDSEGVDRAISYKLVSEGDLDHEPVMCVDGSEVGVLVDNVKKYLDDRDTSLIAEALDKSFEE
jgi:hypothetical protein